MDDPRKFPRIRGNLFMGIPRTMYGSIAGSAQFKRCAIQEADIWRAVIHSGGRVH